MFRLDLKPIRRKRDYQIHRDRQEHTLQFKSKLYPTDDFI